MPVRRSISFRKLMRKRSKSTEDLSGRYRSTENLTIHESLSSDALFKEAHSKIQPPVVMYRSEQKTTSNIPTRSSEKFIYPPFVERVVSGFPEGIPLTEKDARIVLDKIAKQKADLRDFQRASEIKDLLENCAQITGGRDRKGYLFVTIQKDATEEDVNLDDIRKVVLYLTSTRSDEEKQNGFSFLVCLKPTAPFGSIKPLTKVLQDSFPYKVAQVYAIKPHGYRERLLSTSSKSKFDVNFVLKENLFKYIAPEELSSDFGGVRDYNHSLWFSMRLAFEKFLFESMALSSKLDDIKRSLLQDDFAVNVDGVREQLHHHQHVRKWIVKAPIELLEGEAEKVINIIKTSCDCDTEEELKDEYRNSMNQVRQMIGTLKEQRQLLKELWVSRKGQLEQRFQFNVFKQDTEKMLDWIQDNREEFLCHFTEIGDDSSYAEELREEHKQFEENCFDVQVNIDRILKVADRLKEMQFFDVDLIDHLYGKLDTEWKRLYSAVERRTVMLDASISFHRSSEQYLSQCKLWLEEIRSIIEQKITTQDIVDELLRSHENLKITMKEQYDSVSAEAKALLNVLQRSPAGDARDSREEKARSRLSDYTEAASHVMDVIVEMYEQNKQLSILWEKQKVKIGQKFRLSKFEVESSKILKKLKGSGQSFLSKNPWVGDRLEVAEEILKDQNDFEESFHETYIKSKKLLETATQLAESKECDPAEIKAKAGHLESEVKSFTTKLKKRRELLKMAVNFYKNSQKLSKATDKLKDELHLEASGVEVQNFDIQLERHRTECESTLEKLLATVQDGQTLSCELLQESKVPEKDSRTSFFSHSVEQSRKAVEAHLKELNHNRAQLEKLWKGRQQKLDYWVKVKHYERDTNTLYLDVSKWNTSWQKKELSSDVTKAINLVTRFENEYKDISGRFIALLEEGQQLESLLNTCGIEVTVTIGEAKVDSRKHIAQIMKQSRSEYEVIKKIHHNLKVKYDFSIKQRKLEADAKKVSGWIRHGESILQASQDAGFSMFEAEALLREYERFHNAIETTRLGVVDIKTNAEKLQNDGHPDHITIMQISEVIDQKWKQLMVHAEERRAVVFASYNFYRAAEQVGKLLDKFSKDCRSEEDPCAVFSDYELDIRRQKIEALIKQSEPERKAVEDGCLKVKDSAAEFLKRVLPSSEGDKTPVIDGTVGRLEITVDDLVQQVTSQEVFVLKQIQLRKNVLLSCIDYVNFEEKLQQTFKLIQEQGTVLSEGLKTLQEEKEADEEDEQQKIAHLQKEEEYRTMFLQIREKVKNLIKEAADLVAKLHFHRSAISGLATSVDGRYKDLAQNIKQYRDSLESKLQTTLPEFEEEDEWPSLPASQIPPTELVRHDDSKDSGINVMTEEKRRSVKRIEFIIKELIHTEKTYVDDLKCCIDNFLTPMFKSSDMPEALVGSHDIIFGNIEHIHEFHSKIFLRELEKYENCAENVGKCFIEWADKFHMYVDFCANKPDSNSLLIEHGETFFEDLQQKQNLGLSLAAYLIKPVQRITKYQLLLKDLLSCCDDVDGSLQSGLDVMLSVPRRANDAMYLCLIKGFDEGSLETLGKILLQDSFTVFDPKHILKKGKERHVFLFEQALLLCKEIKDANGKCLFEYKSKLKTSEMGITEHMAEDKCKFAVWTGAPPFTEEKRIIKAYSEEVKHMWVKEIRGLTQQFQFGLLQPRSSFYPTSPRKRNRKSTSQADLSFTESNTDRMSGDFDTATICSRTSFDNTTTVVVDKYIVTEDFTPKGEHEIAVTKGQSVEVMGRPPGSRSWLVRIMDSDVTGPEEGLVPFQYLKKVEEPPLRNKRSSVETLNSQSSEDSFATDSPKGSSVSISGDGQKTRRRTKSVNISGTLKMKTWSKGTGKKYAQAMAAMQKPPLPSTPARRGTGVSGGGSKKLQALLGAPESDIDLLIRPNEGNKYATLGRSPGGSAERVKFLHANEPEDAGFQEGDYDSEGDSMSDSNELYNTQSMKGDSEERALVKRLTVLRELIRSEKDYINEIDVIVLKYIPAVENHEELPEDLRNMEKVMFGNLSELLAFHQSSFIKELEECEDSPELLAEVFLKSEKKFELYIQYCANKPRSASLVYDHLATFFTDLSNSLGLTTSLSEYLMKPVQRIMKYHAILKDFAKYTIRAGLNNDQLNKALHVMQRIPKIADDVMHVGMLEGFKGNLNDQGKLLTQDTLLVTNPKANEPEAERRVFLFEKVVIFSEPFERKTGLKTYLCCHCVDTSTLGLTTNYDDDPCKLAVWSKRESGSSEIYVLTAMSAGAKKTWIDSIRRILEEQHENGTNVNSGLGTPKNVLKVLKAYRKRASRVSVTSNTSLQEVDSQHCNGGVPRAPNADMGKITPTLQHVNLVPLKQLNGKNKSEEDIHTKSNTDLKRYVVTENYTALSSEELTVQKGEIVGLVHRDKKSSHFYTVQCWSRDDSGLVPSKLLHKFKDKHHDDSDGKIKRSSSFGKSDKQEKKDKKKDKKANSSTLLRTASLKRKKKEKEKLNGELHNKPIIDTLQQHWTSNFDSSDDETKEANIKATESLNQILQRDPKTTFEVAPEFKILPRDVTVEVATHVKLTCTVLANPAPTVVWTKNEQHELTSDEKYSINFKNSLCTFEILNTELSDTGTYTVTATNELGAASYSAKISVRCEARPGVPSKPHFSCITSSSVDVRWNSPVDSDTVNVSGYSVQYQAAGSSTWETAIAACDSTSTTVENLVSGQTYRFMVTAHNENGMSLDGEPSDPILISDQTETPRSGIHEIKWREKIENHYQICGELGRGRWSIVKRCVEKSTNKEYAAKIVRRRMVSKENVESEVAILQALRHPAIVALHEIYDAPNGLVLVEQLLAGGRLFDHVVIMDNLNEQMAIRYIKELLMALNYLHKNSIAHLDVKPENILLTGGESPSVVLSDFGDATRLSRRVPYQHQLAGNPEFAAPEIVSGDTVSFSTDMWSVGVVVFVLLGGVSPFYSDNRERACANVTEIRYTFPEDFFANISDEAKDFIEELLVRDQASRPDSDECLRFAWMRMSDPPKTAIGLSRLAAFNARRRYQYESSNTSTVTSSQLLSSPQKKTSTSR